MGYRIIIEVDDEELRIEKIETSKGIHLRKHEKVYALPEGTVRDGYLLNTDVLKDILKHYYERYGGSRDPVTFLIHSTTVFRWLCTLPASSRKEMLGMLEHHKKGLLPVDTESYEISYQILSINTPKGGMDVGLVGIPKVLRESYMQIGKVLKLKVKCIVPSVERMAKSIPYEGKEMNSLLIYARNQKLFGAIVENGFCSMTQNLLREYYHHETQEMCFLNHLLHLLHFQREEEKELPQVYVLGDEKTLSTLQEMGVQDVGKYFEERLHMTIQLMPYTNGYKALNQYLRSMDPLASRKKKMDKPLLKSELLYYGMLVSCGITIAVLGGSQLQKFYYKEKLKDTLKVINGDTYASMQQLQQKQDEIALKMEQLEAVLETIDQSCRYVEGHVEKLDEALVNMQHLVKGYTIDALSGSISLTGHTPSAYGLLGHVKKLEKSFEGSSMKLNFMSSNRLGPSDFQIIIAQRMEEDESLGEE